MNFEDTKDNIFFHWVKTAIEWLKPFLPMLIPPLLFHSVKKKQKKMSFKEHVISFLIGTCSTIAISNIVFYFIKVDSYIFRTFVNCFLYATAEPLWGFIINLKIGSYVYSLIKIFFESVGDLIKNKLK